MSKIYVCDICKEQFVEPYKIKKMKLETRPDLELCTICANELVQHINARIKLYSKEEKMAMINFWQLLATFLIGFGIWFALCYIVDIIEEHVAKHKKDKEEQEQK